MKQSILSAIIVLIAGYIGAFLPPAFCIIITIAVATGCIVYAIKQKTLWFLIYIELINIILAKTNSQFINRNYIIINTESI